MATDPRPDMAAGQEGIWRIEGGEPAPLPPGEPYRTDGVENLTYSNPYRLDVERVWFDGKLVYAIESGEVEIAFDEQRVARNNKVAQEYQVVYAVELDERGKLKDGREPERVPGQLNIYDSVPGMEQYSPLWQFNYVIVPGDYEPTPFPSGTNCRTRGNPIPRAPSAEN